MCAKIVGRVPRQPPPAAGGGAGLSRRGQADAGRQPVRVRQAGGRQFLWPGPVHPARTSRILDLVDPALGPAIVVPEDASVAELRAAANKARVLVLDASSQGVGRVAQLSLHACLWAGSPGMAQALAFQLGARRRRRRRAARRVLVVVGSANRVSHEQCAALQAAGAQHPGRRRDPRRRLRRVPAGARATRRRFGQGAGRAGQAGPPRAHGAQLRRPDRHRRRYHGRPARRAGHTCLHAAVRTGTRLSAGRHRPGPRPLAAARDEGGRLRRPRHTARAAWRLLGQ